MEDKKEQLSGALNPDLKKTKYYDILTEIYNSDISSGRKKAFCIGIDAKTDVIIKSIAKAYNVTLVKIIQELLYRGILHYDADRKEQGLSSILDITKNFDLKQKEQQQKKLTRELNKETKTLINKIWGTK